MSRPKKAAVYRSLIFWVRNIAIVSWRYRPTSSGYCCYCCQKCFSKCQDSIL